MDTWVVSTPWLLWTWTTLWLFGGGMRGWELEGVQSQGEGLVLIVVLFFPKLRETRGCCVPLAVILWRGRAQTLMARGQLDPFRLSRRRKTWLHRQGLQWFWQWQYKDSSCKWLWFSPWWRKQAYQLVVERRREDGRIRGERDLKWSPLRNVFSPQLHFRITCRTFQIFSHLLPVPYLITI